MDLKRLKTRTLFIFSTLISAYPVLADTATTAVPFLSLGVGARSLAMGEAAVAGVTGAESLFWNPSALLGLDHRAATFMHAATLEETSLEYAVYGQKRSHRAWGLSVQRFATGSIPQTDILGNPTGSISPSDLAVSLGLARRFRSVDLGGSVKFIHSKLVDSAQTGAVDFGVRTAGLTKGRVRLGLAVSNVGGKLKYESAKSSLPTTARGGLEYRPNDRWSLGLDVVSPKGEDLHAALGGEFQWSLTKDARLSLRGGYNTRDLDGGSAQGLSAGVGIGWGRLLFDYAFVSHGDLDPSQVVSISGTF